MVNIFLGSVLPAFHLEDSAVYVMIVYLFALALLVAFEFYLACSKETDDENYRVISKPQDDEVELDPVPFSQATRNIRKVSVFILSLSKMSKLKIHENCRITK